MKPERRQFIRVRTRLTTFVTLMSNGKVQRALTRDIGGGGVCLLAETALSLGTEVKLEIQLPDREAPIASRAVVLWSRTVAPAADASEGDQPTLETGMSFLEIDPKERALLTQYARLNAVPEMQ